MAEILSPLSSLPLKPLILLQRCLQWLKIRLTRYLIVCSRSLHQNLEGTLQQYPGSIQFLLGSRLLAKTLMYGCTNLGGKQQTLWNQSLDEHANHWPPSCGASQSLFPSSTSPNNNPPIFLALTSSQNFVALKMDDETLFPNPQYEKNWEQIASPEALKWKDKYA
ncbi:hypothetical protein VP01_510g20 [Puccinia sorghi]|uniref:Uncharacterized protein n=1 Tax=Puccinia sorghi TaxID=27349 RepID=A0A0L6UL74_9BASI|nr:hypothetical protein VP01_510g20 [Puccinia sorghi]